MPDSRRVNVLSDSAWQCQRRRHQVLLASIPSMNRNMTATEASHVDKVIVSN